MRFIYLLLLVIFVINLLILLIGEVLGVNLYKKYKKEILNFLYKFLLMILSFYIALALIGLADV